MKLFIGLCYDLKEGYLKNGFSATDVREFEGEATLLGLEDALSRLGHTVERIGKGRKLVERLASGERWDLIFNVAEGAEWSLS